MSDYDLIVLGSGPGGFDHRAVACLHGGEPITVFEELVEQPPMLVA